MKTLTDKQKDIIYFYKADRFRTDSKGRLFYSVSSNKRRNNRMLVTQKEIDSLKKLGLL